MVSYVGRLGLALLLMLTACAPAAAPQPGAPVPQETRAERQHLRVAVKGIFGNPTPQASATLHFVYYPLYDSLTKLSEGYQVKPWVAERWALQDNAAAWRFFLRRDMTWPDGTKLTAEDVAFTLDTVIKNRWPQLPYFENVTGARVVDDYTVDFLLRQPDMSIPAAANFLWLVPKKYFESVGFDGFVQKPMGSGPYELVSFRNTEGVHYRKRSQPHAFRKAIADEIVFTVIAENAQIINGLRTGEIDLAVDVNFTAEQANTLKQASMDVHVGLSTLQYIALPQGVNELRKTPFTDKRVRQALWYAINRQAIATTLFQGYAQPAISVAVPGTAYHDPTIALPPYDPARARQLLTEAGYPNGFRLPVGLGYTTAFNPQDVVVAIQSNLRDVGIEFTVVPNERAVAVDKAYGRNNLQKEDIWMGRQGDPLGFGGNRTFFGCGKPVGDPSALYWCNPEWDRLQDAALAERDPTRRAQLLRDANRLMREDAPVIPLYLPASFVVHSPKLAGLDFEGYSQISFDAAYRVK